VGAEEKRGQRGMGDDVLWEIHCRRTMASYDYPFPMLHEFASLPAPPPHPPAHVISRCLAFWFLVYSQSILLLSMFLCLCVRGVVGYTAIFRGDPSLLSLLFGLTKFVAIALMKIDKIIPSPESASELYRPSDRCLSAKLMPIFAVRSCRVVSATDPYGRILGFLDWNR
jgi:hypothetical protein